MHIIYSVIITEIYFLIRSKLCNILDYDITACVEFRNKQTLKI